MVMALPRVCFNICLIKCNFGLLLNMVIGCLLCGEFSCFSFSRQHFLDLLSLLKITNQYTNMVCGEFYFHLLESLALMGNLLLLSYSKLISALVESHPFR